MGAHSPVFLEPFTFLQNVIYGIYESEAKTFFLSYHCSSIRLGPMLQQNIDYVCVPLLCCLVKWCVTIL